MMSALAQKADGAILLHGRAFDRPGVHSRDVNGQRFGNARPPLFEPA